MSQLIIIIKRVFYHCATSQTYYEPINEKDFRDLLTETAGGKLDQ
jgi:hypothetical protein